MQNPELFIHKINTNSEEQLFADLIEPFDDNCQAISQYRLKHIIPSNGETSYAVFELDHGILGVQFYLDDELLTFGDDQSIEFMSMDEIRLLRELGEVSIDGTNYLVNDVRFNLIDGPMECQHMVVFDLINH